MRRGLACLSLVAVAHGLLAPGAARAVPRAMQEVDIEEHLGARLPLDLELTDQDGHRVHLRDYFQDGKPVVLVLAWLRCPVLCDLVLQGLASTMSRSPALLGRDYRALTVSIDPREKPAQASLKQHGLLQAIGRLDRAADWPFLVGDARSIAALTDRAGFQYAYDAKTDQFAHPACAIVVMPDGRIARYLYGITFRPLDLRIALAEAASGRTGGIVDRVLLTCFRYDPATRRYGWVVRGALRIGASITFVAVAALIALLVHKESARRSRGVGDSSGGAP